MAIIAISAGFMSSALGFGGGILYSPLLMRMGVLPSVASGTGMYLVMTNTAVNSILYAFESELYYWWAII